MTPPIYKMCKIAEITPAAGGFIGGQGHTWRPHEYEGMLFVVLSLPPSFVLEIYRSTDDGETWSVLTTIPRAPFGSVPGYPANPAQYSVRRMAEYLLVLYWNDAAYNLTLARFSMLTGAVTATFPSGDSYPDTPVEDAVPPFQPRSDLSIVASAMHMTLGPVYRTCSAAGAWGAYTSIPFPLAVYPNSCLGAQDRIHFIGQHFSDNLYRHNSIDASNVAGTASSMGYTTTRPVNTHGVTVLHRGLVTILWNFHEDDSATEESMYAVSQASPVWTTVNQPLAPANGRTNLQVLTSWDGRAVRLTPGQDWLYLNRHEFLSDGRWSATVPWWPVHDGIFPEDFTCNDIGGKLGIVVVYPPVFWFLKEDCPPAGADTESNYVY